MELDFAFLANAAEGPNGLINALGAGWDVGNRQAFPAPFAGVLVAKLAMKRTEAERRHTVTLDIVDADGIRIVPTVSMSFQIPTNAPMPTAGHMPTANIFLDLRSVMVPQAGLYSLELSVDAHVLKSFPVTFALLESIPLAG